MAMVKIATLSDNPNCLRRSDEYTAWPTCRSCGKHVCAACTEPFSLLEDDSDNSEGVAEMKITVQCADCLESEGPDEFCTAPEEQDEAYARAEAEYRDLDRGEL